MNFTEKLLKAVSDNRSTVCVGLDPNLDLLPNAVKKTDLSDTENVEQFLTKVIDVTAEYCAAYKPNLGFFEALGADGWDTFKTIVNHIPDDKIIIADAKRGDISSTAEHYAKAFFEQFDIDAITLNPLMGFETLNPFLQYPNKGVYVLTLTSNPGANDILKKELANGKLISNYIAEQLSKKQSHSKTSIGMVVGATQAKDLEPVITEFPQAPLLIPGVGKQGGSINEFANSLSAHTGIPLVNSSRSIIYAGNDSKNWAQAVANSALNLKNRLAPITKRYV